MPRQETTKDVPAQDVDQLVQDYRDAGATDVKKTKQPDGKYTVIATFPDAPAKSSSTSSEVFPDASAPQVAANKPNTGAASAKTLRREGIPWTAQIDGDDIVVYKVKVTAFGGGFDKGDNGQTESGVLNDGSNPRLMGCALPIKADESATKNSPLAFVPHIPWRTKVRFWHGEDETSAIETELIDNGPDVRRFPDHAGDLTVVAAQQFAPHISLKDMANNFEMTLSYRIIGGRNFIS